MPDTVPVKSLATVEAFRKRYPNLTQDIDPTVLQEYLEDATDHLEDLTSRRLAPFTGHIYEDMMWGIDPNEYGDTSAGMPIDIYGSLGVSYANALGAGDLVRHFWLDQYAPLYPELWTYSITEMNVFLTYGNYQPITVEHGLLANSPEITSGHCWLTLGTFTPEGTRIQVKYSGGYTKGIPRSLRTACMLQASMFLIVESETQARSNMNMDEADAQLGRLLAPWMRG